MFDRITSLLKLRRPSRIETAPTTAPSPVLVGCSARRGVTRPAMHTIRLHNRSANRRARQARRVNR